MGTFVSIPGSGKVDVTVFGRGTVVAGAGDDRITITGRGHILVGAGHDTLNLEKGGVIIERGASGQDTIHLGDEGRARIFEQGHATVTGAFGAATIDGGAMRVHHTIGFSNGQAFAVTKEIAISGNVTMLGAAAHAELVARGGFTSMIGGTGNDTFIGGKGTDVMVGGTGQDLFEFLHRDHGGNHLIKNFVSGQDQLYVEGHSLSWLQSHHDITSSGGNTFISIDGGKTTIELQGVSSLKASDITGHKH